MKIKKSVFQKSSFFFHHHEFLWERPFRSRLYFAYLITRKIIKFVQDNKIKNICLYLAEPDQIETLGIMKWCLNTHRNVYVYNFNPLKKKFIVYPLISFNYKIKHVQSYMTLKLPNMKPVRKFQFDLVIVPVYFVYNKTAFYYPLKSYQEINQLDYKFLVGIGYENVWNNHPFYKRLFISKKTQHLDCDEIYFVNDLIKVSE